MKLVLIESSGKQETVAKYLGKGFKVIATKGHVRDLPVRSLGVDVENNFKPEYQIMPDKKKLIEQLKDEAKKSECVYIATDPDREGEAIAWHLAHVLGIKKDEKARIEFNEISKTAITHALTKPRVINENLVDAQQARRVLDRLVGYKLSPLVSNKIQGSQSLSAGRVQSVTLRLVVDKDREIEDFKPEEYWTLTGIFNKINSEEPIKATLSLKKNEKIKDKASMDAILSDLEGKEYVVQNIKKAESKSHPSAPFTTSSMQQDAQSKLGFTLKQTSSIAQNLYEGVTIPGEGKVALITYIRTDSVRVSEEAQQKALEFIKNRYGENYCPKSPNIYKSKKNIQDAHEAIRPITLERKPEDLKGVIDTAQYKLYKLIYDRFLASQMAEAKYDSVTIDIDAVGTTHTFKASGKTTIFDGYTVLYNNSSADEGEEENGKLPVVESGEKLLKKEFKPEQKYTKPPARFTESSLVKAMEDKGIGRPATYSPTVNTLLSRLYLVKEGKYLISTELGRKVVDLLLKYFSDIMDVGFTADMENRLDTIEEGGQIWQDVIRDFYKNFLTELMSAYKDKEKVELTVEESDVVCDKCGAKMVYKMGKFGKFLACPNYPNCKNTKNIDEVVGKCPKCGGELLKKKSHRGKLFYGCQNYPKCDFASWDLPHKDNCPNCNSMMVEKQFSGYKIVKCTKCDYSTRIEDEKIKKENDANDN